MTLISSPASVDILILGAGWTSTFLTPLLVKEGLTYAATTTTGRDRTYKFKFEYDEKVESATGESLEQYKELPSAKTVLITFPIKGKGGSNHLSTSYEQAHHFESGQQPLYIQLGSTGIFSIGDQDLWVTRHSKYDKSNARAIAEDELLALGGCILNLSGLWGGERQPKNWIDRVASTKELLKSKSSLHMIHGEDVARGIVAVSQHPDLAKRQRWMLTDLLVYDWWPLILGFAGEIDAEKKNSDRAKTQIKWVGELMEEQNIRALPRSMEQLGRCYDSREFWTTFGLLPARARI